MRTGPARFPWVVAIHSSVDSPTPVGAGVLVAPDRVLTCAPVVRSGGRPRDELWAAFPLAAQGRVRVRQVIQAGDPDVVLLALEAPAPADVEPARLRLPPLDKLAGHPWWSFGFPDHDPAGRPAEGTLGDPLDTGHVRLASAGLAPGFVGAPVWSPEYAAVVGLVVQAATTGGDGRAVPLADAVPELKLGGLADWRLADAGQPAAGAWGWTRADRGARFRGRTAVLRVFGDWLDRPGPGGRLLVVTGAAGVGKSAVLGRLVTTAEERSDAGVACAVHAAGKSALEVATEIAVAASAAVPAAPGDLLAQLRDRLATRPDRFNLVVDALDEAVRPRELIRTVLVPLARHGDLLGARVVVATRPADEQGDLVAEFGADADVVDLDSAEHVSLADLAAHALATLRQEGEVRADNPYADPARAEPVARRIATLAGGNFLVAGLVAGAHGRNDAEAVDPHRLASTATVAESLDAYLGGVSPAGATSARLALTALAFAEPPGLPLALWRVAIEALGGRVTDEDLAAFAAATGFLVETGPPAVHRLRHRALGEALLGARATTAARADDERDLLYSWIRHGHATGWATAPDYLLRCLARHAERAGLVDTLLNDDAYVLNAELGGLLAVAETADTREGRARLELLRRTPLAAHAAPAERAALFSVVDRIDRVGSGLQADEAAYRAAWAHTPPRLDPTVLEGHSDAVYDVCAVPMGGRDFLASAGADGTVRLWDPLTGRVARVLAGHPDGVRGLWAVETGAGTLLATAGDDGTIGVWQAETGGHLRTLTGHDDWVRNLCAVPVPGGPTLLASASDDRTVRIWNPADGTAVHTLTGFGGWATAVTHLPVGQHGLVAATGLDGVIALWDPVSGACTAAVVAHDGWATTLCAVRAGGGVALASAGYDGVVRLWNPLSGDLLGAIDPQAGPLTDLCTVEVDGTVLLTATDESGVLHLWDARTGEARPSLRGDVSWIRAVCALRVRDRDLLATAGDDGTVRLWDPVTRQPESVLAEGRIGAVAAVCAVPWRGGVAAASTGSEGIVRIWDPASGAAVARLPVRDGAVGALCAVPDAGAPLLATGGDDNVARLWDLRDGAAGPELADHHERVNAVCALEAGGLVLVATGADDDTVRLWNPRDGSPYGVLLGHRSWVTAVTTVRLAGRELLASADEDGTLRLWDLDGGTRWQQLAHADAVNALCSVTADDRDLLVSGGADGTVRLWHPADGRPHHVLGGHTAAVTGVTALPAGDGRALVASTSLDRTVRLWEPVTGRCVRAIPVHHRALSCAYAGGTLVVGLDRGLLGLAV
ncbi:NACHT domain-containing protein [Asanoa sp. WMMD1127]|uniref:NACHT domain-containing protein n=1 Tax=Asanoa sp. WMMD1127 TaxID=3016107 RepID=UPI0024177895|nr:NACHT domain-containing protein [Asanoa sp. WMMD1127]MDG4827471.1 NACHT domain-containing protein [Asanoa sp. WMMD1127]